ncbi:MAG: penicillin-insensitive murein endopeptidase [Lamprobacter sp.]|uniref:penicillin-insensitive murein endopeptidase n=1 Tax=Lamprobacter sp. TaxID=3100796 RepID=UPI002B25C638|nr:penicillin-insensitive murein endopeptidase [Lamprobacter sp.]MEA3638748.1 penicillin-insensitive murein endopeptidase [Lamprobacter sp.]
MTSRSYRLSPATPRHRRLASTLVAGLLSLVILDTGVAAETPWSQIKTTAAGRAESIGGPSNGCVRGALLLPPSGEGFVSIRRHRNRYYGHPKTIALVEELGAAVAKYSGGRLMMVGDLAQPRGGRMASSHVSHQNGLDVDIWLTLADSPRQAWQETPEAKDPPSMLGRHGLQPNARWGADQLFLIKRAAEHPDVDRILVNPGIKRALCRSEGDAPWLRKLRPWWGHDAHMHVRLACPTDSPNCKQQSPIPMGSGCGSELAWWFSQEARSPNRGSSSKPKPKPKPPAACEVVLRAP